jgi:3-hydroxyacyl-CoA dehydrogenase/enoyl-CoA hydratase/3-hydroxybutyryl-CoA epimerase
MTEVFHQTITDEGIAELRFDLPNEKVNTFSLETLKQFEDHLDQLAANPAVKALKLTSGKEGSFIAGADLHKFSGAFTNPEIAAHILRAGHHCFSKLQNMPFPTIAVIHGACLGGGLECSLACTYRVVSDHPKTVLGLPEVTLGLFPGWGGTQRLPRLVGLAEALPVILTGKMISPTKAWKMHLADGLLAWETLSERSDAFIRRILTKEGRQQVEKRRGKRPWLNLILESNPWGRSLLFRQARKSVMERTKGHYPAPLIALEVMAKTNALPLDEGLREEADTFTANIPNGLRNAMELIPLFFTQERAKKETWVGKEIAPTPITSGAIIGAGTMGAGIAWLLADHSIVTRMKDISWELVGKGIGTARALFEKGLKAKKLTPCEFDRHFQILSGTIDYSGFDKAQIVIEAATENLATKRKIFQEVEQVVSPTTVIASNTSSLTITEMSEGFQHPERFVGMHFFNPVHKMPLVEVVAGKRSSPQAVATAVALCKRLGKVPMVVGDCPGFLVNRIFMLGANEVLFMLEEGYAMDTIDQALLAFGMPMGPFVLADEIGNDVTYKVAKTFEAAYGERMRPAELLHLMDEHELYGQKVEKGFYLYRGKQRRLNSDIGKLLSDIGRQTGERDLNEIVPRFLFGMINEALRCREEGIIGRDDFLDLCMIMGIGFPPFQGGLIRYAERVGYDHVLSTLKHFESQLGPRFKPCAELERRASAGT